jgi:hypothetical protein
MVGVEEIELGVTLPDEGIGGMLFPISLCDKINKHLSISGSFIKYNYG